MPIPQEWDLSGKVALIPADRRGWTPTLAAGLAEAGADVAIAGADNSDFHYRLVALKYLCLLGLGFNKERMQPPRRQR